MKKPLLLLSPVVVSVACLLAPSLATAMPTAGSNELRIDSAYLLPGIVISGLNHHSYGGSTTSPNETLFGLGFAYGRFLTNNFEIGTSLTMLYMKSGNSSQTAPGFAPFIRGFALVSDRVAFYGAASAGLQYVSEDGGTSITELTLGADLGLEFFPADSWSLRVGPTYRYLHESMSNGNASATSTDNVIGLNWAIAGYF